MNLVGGMFLESFSGGLSPTSAIYHRCKNVFFKLFFLLLEPLFYYKNVGTSVTQKGVLKTFLIILHRLLRYLKQAGSATW